MTEGRRTAVLALLAFVILSSYEAARPAAESLFLGEYTAKSLPYVWIAVAISALAVVAIYNRFAAKNDLMRVMSVASLASAALFIILLGLHAAEVRGVTFGLYVLKDIYIVLLVEIFWSYTNSVFRTDRAKWTYGFFCIMGSLGAAGADAVVAQLTARFGTITSFYLLIPMLISVAAIARLLPRVEGDPKNLGSLEVLRKSRYLSLMLMLIATTQVVITLIDYSYNGVLEEAYPDTDTRTGVIANVYLAINTSAILFQLASGPILRYLGLGFALSAVPVILFAGLGSFIALPTFILLAGTKVLSKSLDYSLFRAAKEILYIPLSHAERTKGKAAIDVLTYRVAKAFVSLILIALAAALDRTGIAAITLGLIGLWIGLVVVILSRYRA